MTEFRRTAMETTKSIILTAFGGLFAFIITQVFGPPLWLVVLIVVVITGALLYLTVLAEDIRIEVTPEGTLNHYRLGRLVRDIPLSQYTASRSFRPGKGLSAGVNFFVLYFTPLSANGDTIKIDCSPLGKEQFQALCSCITGHTGKDL